MGCATPALHMSTATACEAEVIHALYAANLEALHCSLIGLDEWKKLLSGSDPDEAHFLVYKGESACAWLKLNGLQNSEMAWISMLAVAPQLQHTGIGTYALRFAEDFIRLQGKCKAGIHTTADNIPAQNLYMKCGYTITSHYETTTGNGETHMGITFVKTLIP